MITITWGVIMQMSVVCVLLLYHHCVGVLVTFFVSDVDVFVFMVFEEPEMY